MYIYMTMYDQNYMTERKKIKRILDTKIGKFTTTEWRMETEWFALFIIIFYIYVF